MIIGVCGDIGSGKDTVADYLVEEHRFTRFSFADALKAWVFGLVGPLGVERRHIYGGSPETKQADQAEPLTMLPRRPGFTDEDGCCHEGEHWTGRALCEYLGTEVGRLIHPDVWAARLPEGHYVVPDLRFPNEFTAVRARGGEVWRTKLLVEHGDMCQARWTGWRNACSCGAIESTGHASDLVWRSLSFDRLLEAEKPGVNTLRELAADHYRSLP